MSDNTLTSSSSMSPPLHHQNPPSLHVSPNQSPLHLTDNRTAVEVITERLHEVTCLAEDLDQTLRTAHRDCALAGSGGGVEVTVTAEDPGSSGEWSNVGVAEILHPTTTTTTSTRSPHLLSADYKSDEEFLTASDCTPTVHHSRSSSYNTVSDCEQQFAPWWEYGAEDGKDGVGKEKMVLAVGLPELPQPEEVLKPSLEVPPGKIAREVTETTHIRVQQVHTMGVKSFVLTSEMVRDNKTLDPAIKPEESLHVHATLRQQQQQHHERISPIPVPIVGTVTTTEPALSKTTKRSHLIDSDSFEKKLKECGDWIQLKFLECEPELTSLGDTLDEALILQKAHDEVLRQLQNKQSPVEELLRQADKLISLQQPKADVYAAMAESLARAWNDVNAHLELRKQILDLNVQYHTIAKEFFNRNDALEASCKDTLVPVEIDAVKRFLTSIHDLRRGVLEALMGALQAGNGIIVKLQELGDKGTLDSRPDKIRPSVNKAIAQVQRWMDDLHMKRQVLEATFIRRKSQLEQCLALAILAADLRELDDGLQSRKQLLRSTDQLGDSAASADLLLHEHLQLAIDAKQLQDRAVKITKATEQLVLSGCFAGEEATNQAYAILDAVSEYVTAVQQRGSLLERAMGFFKSAQEANRKLDQIQLKLTTSSSSPHLIQLHSESVKSIEIITSPVLTEGHSLLAVNASTDGLRRVLEELENRKIQLDGMCTAHKEEVQRMHRAHNEFLIKEEELQGWLQGVAEEAFIDKHRNMGNNAQTSQEFLGLHSELLADLQTKGNEINTLLLKLPPILEHLADHQRANVDHKVESLHERWMFLKNLLEKRIDLAAPYAKFHRDAKMLQNDFDRWEGELQENADVGDDVVGEMERKWEELRKLYTAVKGNGGKFLADANKASPTALQVNIPAAVSCVQGVLDALARKQVTVTGQWQTWQTDVLELREVQQKLDISMEECTQVIQIAAVIDTNLYPVISTSILDAKAILTNIKLRQQRCVEDLQKIRKNVDIRLQTISELIAKSNKVDETSLNVKNKLLEMKEKLFKDYQNYSTLTNEIVRYFGFIVDLVEDIKQLGVERNEIGLPNEAIRLDSLIHEHEIGKETILKVIKTRQNDVERLVDHINQQEPAVAAQQDIDKIQQVLAVIKENWEVDWLTKSDLLSSHKRLCQFDSDLQDINYTIDELSKRVQEIKHRFGESLSEARSNSNAFGQFEKTCNVIDQRINAFIKTGEELLKEKHVQSPHIERQIAALKNRWNDFRNQVKDARRLIDLSVQYFDLIVQADGWFEEANQLLVDIARETAFVKKPEQAQKLLDKIEVFLKPGELKQNERIGEISRIAIELFGDTHSVNKVLVENREILSSFNSLSHDLSNLAAQLAQAQEAQRLAELEAEKVKAAEAAARLIEESVIKQKIEMAEMRRTPIVMERPIQEKIKDQRMEIVQVEERAVLMEAPVFIQPLRNEIVDEGQRFTFCCQVSGSPQPIISWHKSGICIQQNPDYVTTYDHRTGRCTLTIDETFAEDSASYMCRAISAAGTAETVARLEIREVLLPVEEDQAMIMVPPMFVRALEPMTAQEGVEFSFSCLVQGNPLPTVQWFKNNECIDNSNEYGITYNNGEAVVRFDKIKVSDKGEYTCKANNVVGAAQSTASLNILPVALTESPAFITLLSNVMARAGQKIKLECEVTGVPTPDVQWSNNGKTIHASSSSNEIKLLRDGTKATLIVSEAFPKDAGTYTVTAWNLVGSTSSTSSVSVKGRLPTETSDSELASDMEPIKPSISVSLKDVSINEGNRLRLDCVIVGQPEPEVIWYHNDSPVKESPDFQLLFHGDRCSLIIKEVLPEDAGKYKVVALNSAGEASSQCSLSVTPLPKEVSRPDDESYEIPGTAPKFVKLLSDILIAEGEPAVLEATVTADPTPDVTWYLNNQVIRPTDHVKITQDQQGNLRLEINNILPEDRGVYTVKASNPCGDAKCFAQLIVKTIKQAHEALRPHEENKTAPVFKEAFPDQTVFAQNSIKFECKVYAKPIAKIRWLFNDQPVSGKNFLVSTSGDRQILTIPEVSLENAGKITCVAENEVGRVTCTANLTVQSVTDLTLPHLEKSLEDITVQSQPLGGGLFKQVKHFSESNFSVKREVHVESSQSSTSKTISSADGAEPIVEEHKVTASSEKHLKQINQETPEVRESAKMQEYHKFGKEAAIVQGESVSSAVFNQEKVLAVSATPKKTRPPKFVTPVIGKIVDQGVDVVLEGILDGSPTPEVSWTKNGLDLNVSDNVKVTYAFNCAKIEIKNAGIQDAGRYTCTAINAVGKAVSTSDLVIRKSVFPPVFGRRLQAQVIKKKERVHMEVEVTGTPEPTVTWFKDGIPIYDRLKEGFRIKTQGSCHTLVIEKADNCHTGKYMVRAVNSGGEAQSIADVAVYEPTPDTMIEVVKTVVFEDVEKHESLATSSDQVSSSITSRTSPLPKPPISKIPVPITLLDFEAPLKSVRTEVSQHVEETVRQESLKFTLKHTAPEFSMELMRHPPAEIIQPAETMALIQPEEESIQTSSITKQSSLDFFVKKMKETEEQIIPLKELSKVAPIKQELYTKFEEIKAEPAMQPKVDIMRSYTPYQQVSQEYASQIQKQVEEEFILAPEPPAEICFFREPELTPRRIETHEQKIMQFEEKHKVDAPSLKTIITESTIRQDSFQTRPEPLPEYIEPVGLSDFKSQTMTQKMETTSQQYSKFTEQKQIPIERPRTEGILMEKTWAHKHTEANIQKSWPPSQTEEVIPIITPTWSAQSTLEKKWTPREQSTQQESKKIDNQAKLAQQQVVKVIPGSSYSKTEYSMESAETIPPYVPHYVAHVSHSANVHEQKHIVTMQQFEVKKSQAYMAKDAKQFALPQPIMDAIRPVSVQDITDEVYLQPGSPPQLGFAEPPKTRKLSYVETIEQDLARDLQKVPTRVLPGAVRTVPPPLPLKKEIQSAPAIPAKPILKKEMIHQQIVSIEQKFERFPELEPFPFIPEPERPRPVVRLAPPPTPSKFVKGKFTDSDYESDFEATRISSKRKTSASDNEELGFRHVDAPKESLKTRSKSQDRDDALAPSEFEQPVETQGTARPFIDFNQAKQLRTESQSRTVHKHFTKTASHHEIKKPVPLPAIKPGSPPEYVVSPEPKIKPQSPKAKHLIVIDGYMADTDEPLTMIKQEKKIVREEHRLVQSQQQSIVGPQRILPFNQSKIQTQKFSQHKKHVSTSTASNKELVSTPIISVSASEKIAPPKPLEACPYKSDPPRPKKPRVAPPAPSPSKFIKGDFKESDYESDYDSRINSIWGADMRSTFKPVRPILTPGQKLDQREKSPTPPTIFDRPTQITGVTRPKFQPIEKPFAKSVALDDIIKPVAFKQQVPFVEQRIVKIQPGSPPEIAFAPPPKPTQYYRSTTSAPYHNAVQTETSNAVHFNESTEHAHRTMSVQQTTKVIKFGQQEQKQERASRITDKLEPFPFKSEPVKYRRSSAPPPNAPSKFIPGEFRESDYESEIESAKIKPKWIPEGSDTDEPQYRKVAAPPSTRSLSVPSRQERVQSPLEFDRMLTQTQNFVSNVQKRYTDNKSQVVSTIKPGSPPEYAFAAGQQITKSSATKIASKHMDSMTQSFKSKAQQFVTDIMEDVSKKTQETNGELVLKSQDDTDAQVYREETRAADYGTKHVDPDTGLIYFKYDFGYEFGIVLPGESKSGTIPNPPKTIIQPPKRQQSIEMPVLHETKKSKQNGTAAIKSSGGGGKGSTPLWKPSYSFEGRKGVKWEPTSESEMSEYEQDGKRTGRWSSCSPASISPSPSPYGAVSSSKDGELTSGHDTPANIQPSQRVPSFITPLRDIAVVSGQSARFECIVQSELPLSILWSKDGRILQNSNDYQIFFKNGVCRLTIAKTYPEDAGTYVCTATNNVGSTGNTATLQVPGERRSFLST